ncbi:10789_t:CDS:2, partial [Dentiscutata erythropus]
NSDQSCDEYITQPSEMDIGDSLRPLVGKFLPKGNITLHSHAQRIQRISYKITINNSLSSGAYAIGIYHDNFTQSLNLTNFYYLSPQEYYVVMFSRKVKKTLDKKFSNYIGIGNTYSSVQYIESNIRKNIVAKETLPLQSSTSYNLAVDVIAQSYTTEEFFEQRSGSIIDVLADIFAIYTGGAIIYAFLFGERIEPLGTVHKLSRFFPVRRAIEPGNNV